MSAQLVLREIKSKHLSIVNFLDISSNICFLALPLWFHSSCLSFVIFRNSTLNNIFKALWLPGKMLCIYWCMYMCIFTLTNAET